MHMTFLCIDTLLMLSDINDFIDLSENNIEHQKHLELSHVEQKCGEMQIDNPHYAALYLEQMTESIHYRFDVSLTQRTRYAALISLITTIEWTLISLKNRAPCVTAKTPRGKSEAVHLLKEFNATVSFDLGPQIELIETLVQVRNCIVHAAGLFASYKYEKDLRERLISFSGIKVSKSNLLGDSIEIEDGHLQSVIKDAKQWLLGLEQAMHEKGLLKNIC